ncbi:MAG: DUF5034 domain-containing protein [Bacteroidales bacterium]|jgi:hypothetical protein|nr:DUF5034 domain-containing protein [Bacteroidales bacterium]
MNYKRLFIFPILIVFVLLIDTGCEEVETYYFEWNNMSVSDLEIYYENEELNYRQTDKLTFNPLTYGTRIEFDYQVLANSEKAKINIIQSAYAFTKPSDKYILKDTVSSIMITTEYDFDDEHLAGSNVTEYFKTRYGGEFIPVDSRLKDINAVRSYEVRNTKYDIYLRENPSSGSKQKFNIEVKFGSGKTLTQQTEEIEIE